MDKLSPFQIGLMAVFGVLALVGLFVFANFSGFGGSKVQVGEVLIWGTLPETTMKDAIQELASTQSQYAKVQYEEHSPASFNNDLADALASGSGPDAVLINQEMLYANAAKLRVIPFATISQRSYLDSYLPIFELFLTDTGTFGIPYVVDPLVMYYNRGILSSEGVASAPSTWEAVAGLAPVVTNRTDSGAVTRSLISLGEYGNVKNSRAILSALLLQAGTSISAQGTQGLRATLADAVDNGFGATPAESAVNFYAQFADPAKTLYSWNRSLPDSRSFFLAGDLALYPGFASERAFLSDANPNLDFDMAKLPVPGTLKNRVTYGLGYAFAITKASANAAGAQQAIFALTEKTVAATAARSLGMAPARRSSLVAANDDKYGAIYYPEALLSRGWLSPAPSVTDATFSTMIGDITSGRRNVQQALNAAAQALNAAY